MQFISNADHYKEVLSQVQSVKHSLWIDAADIKVCTWSLARRRSLYW